MTTPKRSQATIAVCLGPNEIKVLNECHGAIINVEGYVSRSAVVRRLIYLGAKELKRQHKEQA